MDEIFKICAENNNAGGLTKIGIQNESCQHLFLKAFGVEVDILLKLFEDADEDTDRVVSRIEAENELKYFIDKMNRSDPGDPEDSEDPECINNYSGYYAPQYTLPHRCQK